MVQWVIRLGGQHVIDAERAALEEQIEYVANVAAGRAVSEVPPRYKLRYSIGPVVGVCIVAVMAALVATLFRR